MTEHAAHRDPIAANIEQRAEAMTNTAHAALATWSHSLDLAHQAITLTLGRLNEARTKAEAAGVLYGEALFRELDIALDQARRPLIGDPLSHNAGAADLIKHGQAYAATKIEALTAAVDQWAADYRQHDASIQALTDRLAELEQALGLADTPPPTQRADQVRAALTQYFATIALTAPEVDWLRATIGTTLTVTDPPATEAAAGDQWATLDPPDVAAAAAAWHKFAHDVNHRPLLDVDQARAIVAVRQHRGIGLTPQDCDNPDAALAWVDWARAGFPEHSTP